jgi:hypothetical protein
MKALICVALLAGCTSLRDRADSAMQRGDYLQAATMYDQLATANPKDAAAIARRDQARASVLRVDLYQVQRAREAGQTADAIQKLGVLLEHRDGWGGAMPPVLGPALAFEVSSAGAHIGGEVSARTAADGALAGEATEAKYAGLLARRDFAPARETFRARLADAGAASCNRLTDTATSPYWTWLAAKYCEHFGVAHDLPPLPDHRTDLSVEGAVAGASASESARMRDELSAAFRKSAWFAPSAPTAAHATLDGKLAVDYASRQVTLTASWTESVPYTDYETSQESYQEPYDDTESYSEDVPTTEYRTETVPCGETTCTNSVPETVYHTEWKTRTVTKYRTAWRTVTNPVTRYRDESHAQDYQATERSASYASALRVRTDAGLPALVASVDVSTSESGYDHDVTIAPAGVSPSRANLTSQDDFAAHEQSRLATRLVQILDDAYAARFCAAATFTLETAAECAYMGPSHLPANAHAALRAQLGGDEPYLSALLAR